MSILFAASSFAPFSGYDDLSEAYAAISKALRGLGHRVTVILPADNRIEAAAIPHSRRRKQLSIESSGHAFACDVWEGRTSAGVRALVMDLGDGSEASRADRFATAVGELARIGDVKFDVFHGHGELGALTLLLLCKREGRAPSVLTIEAPEQSQGWSSAGHNPLLEAIRSASHVVTFFPRGRVDELDSHLTEIPCGVDVAVWNPAVDPHLPARFDPINQAGKSSSKAKLQQELGLAARPDVPLIGLIGGGLEVARACDPYFQDDLQIVVQIAPSDPSFDAWDELRRKEPDKVRTLNGPDEPLTHHIVGAIDFMIIPKQSAVIGSPALVAFRYGAVPIMPRHIADVMKVVPCDELLQTGSAFLFDENVHEDLRQSIEKGITAFALAPAFEKLRKRIMQIDCSWERSVRLLDQLYRDLVSRTNEAHLAPNASTALPMSKP